MTPRTKEEAAKQAYEQARDCGMRYHGCPQCTIIAVQDALGMRDDNVFKAASGLAGGIGLQADVCGAVTGAGMMLSSYYGRERDDLENFEKLTFSNDIVGKLYKWFEKEFGTTSCRELRKKFTGGVHYELGVSWQKDICEEDGVFEMCADAVGRTAAKVTEILWDAIEQEKKK